MDVIYGLIPIMIALGVAFVIILFWAIKAGQFDDLEGDAHRILMDDDVLPQPPKEQQSSSSENTQNKQSLDTGEK